MPLLVSQPLQSLPLHKTLPKGSLALSKHRKLFHITQVSYSPHLIRNAQNLNLRMHHNFKAEDFVGQISVVGHSVSFGNAATRVCQKLTQKYLILLHLQLTRPGFGTLAEDDADPWTHWQNGDPCTTSCQKRLALSFTPRLTFNWKWNISGGQKWCKTAAEIFCLSYLFWQGKKVCFLLIFQVVLWLIFMGSKSIIYNWKKQGANQQVLGYWLESISDAQGLSFAAEDRKSYWSGCIQAAIVICQQIFAILALVIFLLKILLKVLEIRIFTVVASSSGFGAAIPVCKSLCV